MASGIALRIRRQTLATMPLLLSRLRSGTPSPLAGASPCHSDRPHNTHNPSNTMKIKELIKSVSNLVESREIIEHGSIRCLHSAQTVREIESAEGCDEVETNLIGDDDLATELSDLADDGDRIADLDLSDLVTLEEAFRGESISNYVQADKEDELVQLDKLIDAAREIV